jgi:cytochrome c oxidase subunit 4
MQHRDESLKTCVIIYALLIALLVLTVAAADIDFAAHGYAVLNIVIAMIIATVKAVLVVLFFMHVRLSSRLTWLFASAAFFFLGLLLVFTILDYNARPIDGTIAQAQNAPAAASFDHP